VSEPAPDKPPPKGECAAAKPEDAPSPVPGAPAGEHEKAVEHAKPKAAPRPALRARASGESRPTPVGKPIYRKTTKLVAVSVPPAVAISDPKARIGRVLRERWRIDDLVWSTPASSLYWATHRAGTRAAIRVLSSELSADPRRRSAFFETAQIAQRIDHDAAVRVLDDDVTEDGAAFIVLELFTATSLADMLRFAPGPLDTDEALRIGDGILDVLAVAHGAGVHHGSLRAEDVYLTPQGRVRVLGFGGIDAEEAVNFQRDTSAAGVLLHLMLTGEPPRGIPLASRPSYRPERVSSALAEVVDRALGVGMVEPWVDAPAMAGAFRAALRAQWRESGKSGESDARIDPAPLALAPVHVPSITHDAGHAMNPIFFGERALHRRVVTAPIGPSPLPPAPLPASPRSAVPLLGPKRTPLVIAVGLGLVLALVGLVVFLGR
jgi:hypothetical protein